jgi:hypothetical protein
MLRFYEINTTFIHSCVSYLTYIQALHCCKKKKTYKHSISKSWEPEQWKWYCSFIFVIWTWKEFTNINLQENKGREQMCERKEYCPFALWITIPNSILKLFLFIVGMLFSNKFSFFGLSKSRVLSTMIRWFQVDFFLLNNTLYSKMQFDELYTIAYVHALAIIVFVQEGTGGRFSSSCISPKCIHSGPVGILHHRDLASDHILRTRGHWRKGSFPVAYPQMYSFRSS